MHEIFSKSAKYCTFIPLQEEFLMNELPSCFKVKGETICFLVLVWKSNQAKIWGTISGWSRKVSAISYGCLSRHTLFKRIYPIFHLKPLELLLFKYIMNIQHLYTYKYMCMLVWTHTKKYTYIHKSYISLLRINSRISSQKYGLLGLKKKIKKQKTKNTTKSCSG